MTGESVGAGRTVLLVEDEPLQAKLVSAHLRDAGFRVLVATNAEMALRMAATRAPDVVLSDVLMRGTDGFTLCRALRTAQRSSKIPVVLMSAHFQHSDDRELAAALGAEALVERSPTFTNELDALTQVLSRHAPSSVASNDAEELYHQCVTNQLTRLLSRAENADAQFRMVFRHSHDLLLVLALDGTVLEANERARVLLETPERPLVGRSALDPSLGLHTGYPDGLVRATADDVVSTLRRVDGTEIHLTFSLTRVVRAEGDVFLGVGRDVTERIAAQRRLEASELQYRTLVENMPDVVWTMALDGTTGFVSRNMERLCGSLVTNLDRCATSEWMSRTHELDRAKVTSAWSSLSSEGSFNIEYRWRHRDGSWLWFHERATVRTGRTDGIVDGLISDISERKRLELQLWQSQKMEALGLLTGGIAHDFNNVLAVILGNSHFLLDGLTPNDPRREDVHDIERAAQRAANLTRQLLAFARRQVLAPMPLDMNEVLFGVEKMLRHVVRENISLEFRRGEELGVVRADIGQLEQVLMNLAVNARDAMPDGGTLLVETENVLLDREYALDHDPVTPGRYVMLAVSDTGAGMDAETRRRAFEPFFTTKGADGTGLGLASTYGIVKQSGGFIWLYSEPGHGTTFRIYLPRIDEPACGIEPKAPLTLVRGTETVLLVEDDSGLRAALRRMLASLGYTVLLAGDAEEALALASEYEGPIDAVLSDVMLPGLNGIQLVGRLRELRPAMKVLLVSGYTDLAAMRIGALVPGSPFLQKPFSTTALAVKIRQVLDGGSQSLPTKPASSSLRA